jgi:exodeoxyribonuclease V alpha subunit
VNQAALSILDREGLINAAELCFRGRPVLVTRNDYQLKLFNGDIGIAFPDTDAPGESAKSVFFPSEGRQLRKVIPMRLPEHETVYAMTVHKSQGSEFDRVVIVLPDNQSPVLTREPVTGITRAKSE